MDFLKVKGQANFMWDARVGDVQNGAWFSLEQVETLNKVKDIDQKNRVKDINFHQLLVYFQLIDRVCKIHPKPSIHLNQNGFKFNTQFYPNSIM